MIIISAGGLPARKIYRKEETQFLLWHQDFHPDAIINPVGTLCFGNYSSDVSSLRMQGSPESRLKYQEISARLQRVYFTLSFYTNSSPQLILHYSALQFFRDVRSGSVCCWQGYILVFEILIPIFRFEIEKDRPNHFNLFNPNFTALTHCFFNLKS